MTNSKLKGKAGELEAARELARLFGCEARRGQQYSGGGDSPDVITSIYGVHFEVKRTNVLRLNDAMAQAVGDAGEKVPVVLHRANCQEWRVTLRLEDLPRLATQLYLTMVANQ